MIKGDRIIIRPIKINDLEKFRALRNDPETNIYLTTITPINEAMQQEWFKKMNLDPTKIYFVIEDQSAEFVGLVRCDEWDKINRSIRIGVDISKEFRRQGYASETYKALFNYFFIHFDMHRIWLLVVDFNKPAQALYKKLGFKEEGIQRDALYRNNMYNAYIMMSMLKSEFEKKYGANK